MTGDNDRDRQQLRVGVVGGGTHGTNLTVAVARAGWLELVAGADPDTSATQLRVLSDSEFATEIGEDAVGFSGPLGDRVEITELYETYVDAVAMNDAELWASTWVDECVWHIAGHTTEGKEKTVALWKQFMDSFSRALFSGFIGSVAVDDDTAAGRYHTVEELWPKTGGVQRLQGRYADEMVRRAGRWLFKSRSYTVVQEVPVAVPDHG